MRILITLFCLLYLSPLRAETCAFPDSNRGEAPEWVCEGYERGDATYLTVVQRPRMPSVSLQNRLAGREAMASVCKLLLEEAAARLQAQLPTEVALSLPDANDIERLSRFEGITVFERVKSPRRFLYVLAGVPEAEIPKLLTQARREVLAENEQTLKQQLGEAAWAELQEQQ